MSEQSKMGPSGQEARASLPEELRPVFDQLVKEYRFQVLVVHNSRMYAPKVLAELVRVGWRPSAEEVTDG